MDLEEKLRKYDKNFLFRTGENFKFLSNSIKELEVPIAVMGALSFFSPGPEMEFSSPVQGEPAAIALLGFVATLPSVFLASGFIGRNGFLKNFVNNRFAPWVSFSLATGTTYYMNSQTENFSEAYCIFDSLRAGFLFYYGIEAWRCALAVPKENIKEFFKKITKKEGYSASSEFMTRSYFYSSKEDLLSLIPEIFQKGKVSSGLFESTYRLVLKFDSDERSGNSLIAKEIQRFHISNKYSKVLSEIDKLEGFENEEKALVKAYYVSRLYEQENVIIPEFLKLGNNPKFTLWEQVWNLRSNGSQFKTLGGEGVYEVSEDFSKYLNQQIIFKEGNVRKEVELLSLARNVFSRYSDLGVVDVEYFCEDGMIMSREIGVEGWDVESSEKLKLVGRGIALLQNNLTDDLESGLVLDLDTHPGNFYVGEKVVFADLRGKDYRQDTSDIVKAASQVLGRPDELIQSWIDQRGHEREYAKVVLEEMVSFPKICEVKELRGKQGSLEIAQRRIEKANWAANQL